MYKVQHLVHKRVLELLGVMRVIEDGKPDFAGVRAATAGDPHAGGPGDARGSQRSGEVPVIESVEQLKELAVGRQSFRAGAEQIALRGRNRIRRTRWVRHQVHDIGRRPSAVQCFQLNPQLGGDGAPAPVLAEEPITPEKQDNFRCTFSEPQPGHGGACCRAADRISSSKSCPQAPQRYS